jgi:N-acetylneuraminic acid mutarotase
MAVPTRLPALLFFATGPFLFLACGDGASPAPAGGSDAGGDSAPAARPLAADPVKWTKAGSLKTARYAHTATLLNDGRVIAIGGEDLAHEMTASVETFDPETARWSAGPPLPEARSNHVAVRLKDGRVLVVGGGKNAPIGQPLGEKVTTSAVLFDPKTNTFTPTGSLHDARSHFHGVLLPSGKVLVAGGGGATQESPATCGGSPYCGPFGKAVASVEIFDPDAGTWTLAAPMATARYSFSLTVLPNGKVVAAGGVNAKAEGFKSVEIYDPAANAWTPAPELLKSPREHHSATITGTGRVFVAGGKNPNITPLNTVQIFDPAGPTWINARSLSSPRTLPGLTTLESGHVLVVAGYDQLAQNAGKPAYLAEAQVYDDETGAWTTIAPLAKGRVWQTTTVLADGRVLVAGGLGEEGELSDCEVTEAP